MVNVIPPTYFYDFAGKIRTVKIRQNSYCCGYVHKLILSLKLIDISIATISKKTVVKVLASNIRWNFQEKSSISQLHFFLSFERGLNPKSNFPSLRNRSGS
jgi:hypothetical protein